MFFVELLRHFDLQIFADGGSAAAGNAGDGAETGAKDGSAAAGQDNITGDNTSPAAGENTGDNNPAAGDATQSAEDIEAEYRRDIEGKYREARQRDFDNIMKRRLKPYEALHERMERLSVPLRIIADKYNIDPDDTEALASAIERDASFVDEAAYAEGKDPEMMLENKRLRYQGEQREKSAEAKRQEEEDRAFAASLIDQEAQIRQLYPDFDIKRELKTNKEFCRMVLDHNISVEAAFNATHPEIVEKRTRAAIDNAVKEAQATTVKSIQTGAMRPHENGIGSSAAAGYEVDVSHMTRDQILDIAERSARGEKVTFGKPK